MHVFISHLYTLLDSGILFWGAAKVLVPLLLGHFLVKALPRRFRVPAFIMLFVIFLPPLFVSTITSDWARGHAALGRYYLQVGDHGTATNHFALAWEGGDRSPETAVDLISCYSSRKAFPEALQIASLARSLHPDSPSLMAITGDLSLYLGHHEAAASIATSLIAHADMFFWMKGYDIQVRNLIAQDRYPEAIALLRLEQERVPSKEVRAFLEKEIHALENALASPAGNSSEAGNPFSQPDKRPDSGEVSP